MIDPHDRRTCSPGTTAREAVRALLETCGDSEVVVVLIDTFLADALWLVAQVGTAVRAGDVGDARLAAHTLKSHGMTFGLPELARVAAGIEQAARDCDLAAAGALVGELAAGFDQARVALGELRDEVAARK